MAAIRFSVLIAAFFISNSVGQLVLKSSHRGAIQTKLLTSGVECLKDNPLSTADIKAFKAKKLNDGDGAKCFAACLFKNFGIMNDKGHVSSENAKRSAKSVFKNDQTYINKVVEIIDTCSEANEMEVMEGSNESCERAKLLFHCLVENGEKLGFDLKI